MRKRGDLVEIRRWHILFDQWLEPWLPPFDNLTRSESAVVTLLVSMVNHGEATTEEFDGMLFHAIPIGDVEIIFYLRFTANLAA